METREPGITAGWPRWRLQDGHVAGRRFLLAALLATSLGTTAGVQAAQLTLAWDSVAAFGATGYYVYYGTSSHTYTSRIGAGNATSVVVPNLVAGQTYYFAVAAYSPQQESLLSSEVVARAPSLSATSTTLTTSANPTVAGAPLTLRATVTGTAPTGSVSFRDGVTLIPGCGSVALTGSGNVRTAACTTTGLAVGARVLSASYSGNATSAASGSLTHTQYVHATAAPSTFADVPADHWAFPAVEALVAHSITQGCANSPRRFCAEEPVNRDEMAVFLGRARFGASFVYSPTGTHFADVAVSHWAAGPIEQLHADGVTSGCQTSPLRYCPDNIVTRDQMAILLLRARFGGAYSPPPATGTVFADVPAGHWAARWIEDLYRLGFTSGCSASPRNYCPGQSISRIALAVFFQRTFNLASP